MTSPNFMVIGFQIRKLHRGAESAPPPAVLDSKKPGLFRVKINKLSTTDNILNGKPCDILYTGYLNKDISFGDIVYFEPKSIQYKKLVNGVIDQLKVSLVEGDGNEILSNFKVSIVLHIV